MCAQSWLRASGLPCSVWANSSGNCGADTAVNRSSDDIRARPKFADYRGSDIYIAHHTNAGGGGTANGTETWHDTDMEHPAHVANSLTLANKVQASVVNAIRDMYPGEGGWANRGVKDSAGGFGEIRIPNRPAILIELAFHDNCSRDAAYLTDNFFRSVAEWGLYRGICEYFGTVPSWDKYSGEYVSDTIPATMNPGQSYKVSVTFRNRGVVWSETRAFRLGAVGDSDPLTGTTRQTITGEVKPGNTYTFNFTLTAPVTPGTYTTDWRMVRDGYAWFGPTLTRQVTVGSGSGSCCGGSDNNRGSLPPAYWTHDTGEFNPSLEGTWSPALNCGGADYWYTGRLSDTRDAWWDAGWDFRGRYAFDFLILACQGGWRGVPKYRCYRRDGSEILARGVNQCDQNGWWNFWTGNFNGNSDRFWRFRIRGEDSAQCGSANTIVACRARFYGAKWYYINDWVCLGGYSSSSVSDTHGFDEANAYLYPAIDTSHGNVIAPALFNGKVPGRVKTGDCNHANSLNFKGNAASYGGGDNMDSYGFAWAYAPEGAGPKFLIGSDDGNRVWVNGTRINDNNAYRGLTRDADETGGIGFQKGWNRILFKVHNGGGVFEGTISLRNGGTRDWNEPSVTVFDMGNGVYSFGAGFEQDWWYPCIGVANFYGASNPQPNSNHYGNNTTVAASGSAQGCGPVPFWKVMQFQWGYGIPVSNYADVSASGTSWSHTQTGVTGHRRFHFFAVSRSGRTSFQNSGVSGGWNWVGGGSGNYMDVYVDNVAPVNPSFTTASAVSTTQINLAWAIPLDQGVGIVAGATEAADETSDSSANYYRRGDVGVQVYRDAVAISAWGVGTSKNDTGLTPNNPYTYTIEARDNNSQSRGAWANTTGRQGATVVWTLSIPPVAGSVVPDNLTPCAGSPVTWSATEGFGAGSVAKYKYAWNQSPTYVWTGSEPDWSADTLQTIPAVAGTWYLHVKGYNGAGVENGTHAYAITTLAAPTTTGIAGSSAVAIGQVGEIYTVTPPPASGSSFVWSVPGGAVITAGGSGPDNSQIVVTFGSSSGDVTVRETTAGGCEGLLVMKGVTVGPNRAPVAGAVKTISTTKNTPVTIYKVKLLAGATDADGDPLSISAAGPVSAGGGQVEERANDVKYTPQVDFWGPDSFTYTISDGQGGTAVGTVEVMVSYGGGLSPNLVYWPTHDGTMFRVTFAGIPGKEYGVEWSEAPSGMPWTWLKNATAGPNGLFEVTDVVSEVPARYYRIVYPPPQP